MKTIGQKFSIHLHLISILKRTTTQNYLLVFSKIFLNTYCFSSKALDALKHIQSNLVIRNFLVILKLFLNAKCSLPLWSQWSFGHEKWFLNTNLFLIKTFLSPSLTVIHIFLAKFSKLVLGIINVWHRTKTRNFHKKWYRKLN